MMKTTFFATPDDAETAFYQAFESRNIDAMMSVWSQAEYIECIHPMGDHLQGVDAIRAGWESLFSASPEVRFHILDQRYISEGEFSFHVVSENLRISEEEEQPSQILATNVYEKTEQGWKMILHHASPASDKMLMQITPAPPLLH